MKRVARTYGRQKRKGFKTSPSIRIPRRAAEKMQAAAAAAAAEVRRLERGIKAIAKLHAQSHARLQMDKEALRVALADAVKFIDRLRNTEGSWTVADVKRMEAIRLLSIL